ncbi:hypothetical protein KJ781_04730, partial [Patescibacteria group bacterium]|nr:hypothetical protein [Patescibacteria group bacterium]MBU1449189.1 hypothetical protein [Patescibacteria group bacterium]
MVQRLGELRILNQIDNQYSYRWLILASALALLLSGLAAIAFSGVPLDELQAWLSSWTVDGKADFLTPGRHQRLVMGTRVIGAACILLSALVWLFRRRIASWIGELTAGLAEMLGDLAQA